MAPLRRGFAGHAKLMPTHDPKTLSLAVFSGIMPALIWLWFWLKEDKEKPEPVGLLTLCFISGMLSVFFVLPLEKLARNIWAEEMTQITAWAAIEEIIKYLVVIIILFKGRFIKDPIDWPIYLITTALGFAAMENVMFLLTPMSLGQATVGLLTGQLRFLGSTLLHAVSTGIVGIFIGLSFFKNRFIKFFYLLWGFILAVALHSVFNFFIIKNNGNDFLKVFAFLWVATIINLLLFEKLRRISGEY